MNGRASKATARGLDWACARLWTPRSVALITGFWRSGTTWLQQLLADAVRAKTVFEPLSPRNPAYMDFLRAQAFSTYDAAEAFMPDLDRVQVAEQLWSYLDDAFRGFCSGHFSLLCRQGVSESLRRRVVVKCVRAAWSQQALHARYGVPIVHVRRHPCAVVASMVNARTWQWSFDNVRLAEVLHPVERGATAAWSSRQLPERYDQDGVSRIAAYWALTESYVESCLRGQPWALTIDYERAVLDPCATIDSLAAFIGCSTVGGVDAARESPVTELNRWGLDGSTRASTWKSVLAPAQVDHILDIVAEIFPASGRFERQPETRRS